ncbi:unnamed protein product [Polarella glacialis]|uniref:Transmembrane protein n=1 Tax=Polarella glacialis TaxID=89957 RepID=A0A813GBC8_POLGL|nr:unnamed protein product [Polarella glacialis]
MAPATGCMVAASRSRLVVGCSCDGSNSSWAESRCRGAGHRPLRLLVPSALLVLLATVSTCRRSHLSADEPRTAFLVPVKALPQKLNGGPLNLEPRRQLALRAVPEEADELSRLATEVKDDDGGELEAKKETQKNVQKKEESKGGIEKKAEEDYRPLEDFYEGSDETVANTLLAVSLSVFLGGGSVLVIQGLDTDYFILVFLFVVVAFAFSLALGALKAITPAKEATKPQTADAGSE